MGMRSRRRIARAVAAAGVGYLGWRALRRADEIDLRGKVALVTGGSRGLGLLLARELAGEGCRVAICARDDQELAAARSDLEARGAEVEAVVCDVADRSQVEGMVAQVIARFGGIDVLINNASIIQVGPIDAMRAEDFERAMAINYLGTVYTTMAVLPQMRTRGDGRIVNITSIGGKVAVPHLLPYDAAKFATVGFSEGMRSELARHGIRVTTIVPGLMRTGSPVNAFFKGEADMEFAWFSLGSATPLTAMNAERAARRIILAAKRGEAEVTLTWQAKLLRLTHDLFPGTTADLLGVVNRMLPKGSDPREVRGMKLSTPVSPSPATHLMNEAAKDNQEYTGRPEPSPEHARQVGLKR
jgi:NAD(P)-dependent dehydrogenase (short-subunit alcohol dehydrogenase family)